MADNTSAFTFLRDEFDPELGQLPPKWLEFRCPRPQRGATCMIALRPLQKNGNGASWEWDGNREAPTISPSVNCGGCGWHGWIKAGEFIGA